VEPGENDAEVGRNRDVDLRNSSAKILTDIDGLPPKADGEYVDRKENKTIQIHWQIEDRGTLV